MYQLKSILGTRPYGCCNRNVRQETSDSEHHAKRKERRKYERRRCVCGWMGIFRGVFLLFCQTLEKRDNARPHRWRMALYG